MFLAYCSLLLLLARELGVAGTPFPFSSTFHISCAPSHHLVPILYHIQSDLIKRYLSFSLLCLIVWLCYREMNCAYNTSNIYYFWEIWESEKIYLILSKGILKIYMRKETPSIRAASGQQSNYNDFLLVDPNPHFRQIPCIELFLQF